MTSCQQKYYRNTHTHTHTQNIPITVTRTVLASKQTLNKLDTIYPNCIQVLNPDINIHSIYTSRDKKKSTMNSNRLMSKTELFLWWIMLVQVATPSTSAVESGGKCTSETRSSWWAWSGGRGCTTTPTSVRWGSSPESPRSVGGDCTVSGQSSSETEVGIGSSNKHVT